MEQFDVGARSRVAQARKAGGALPLDQILRERLHRARCARCPTSRST